jgi:small subunit ribosomal protein S21
MKLNGLTVLVNQDGNVEKALRKFKKKMQESGKLLDIRDRQHYVKPTTKRKLKRNAARGRWKKYLESQKLPPRHH